MQEELENYEFISDIHEEIFRRRLGGEDPRFIARDLAMDLIDVKRSYQRERALFQEHLVDTIPELGDLYDIDNVERRRKRLAKIIGIDQKDIADYHSDTNTLEDNVYRIADTLEHDTMKEVALKMLNGERKKSIAHDLNISKDMVQKYYDQSKRYIKSQLKTYAWENMNNNISTNRDNSHEHVQKLEETLIG